MNITVHVINDKNMAYYPCPKNTMKEMDFERDYLPGVVAGEMGDCSQIEALKAQAIAARSYAYQYILKGAAIYDTSKAQVYEASRAVSKTYLLHRQAAEETAGIVVCYNGKPVTTNYTHSNGGKVKAYGKAWMVAKDDPWDDEPRKGHGAGMSQSGAENMAKAGKTYAEILAFYYPGTVLMGDYGKAPIAENEPTETEVINVAGIKYGYWKASGTIDTLPVNECVWLFNRSKTNSKKMAHIGVYDGATKTELQAGGYGKTITLPSGKKKSIVSEQPFDKKHWTHWCAMDIDWAIVLGFIRAHLGDLYLLKAAGGKVIIDGVEYTVWDCSGIAQIAMRKVGYDWYHGATQIFDRGFESVTQAATPAPASASRPTLYMLTSNDLAWMAAVRELQTLLNKKNEAGLKVDGKFGKITRKAVIRFQEMNGLDADGIVGVKTWAKLTA